MSEPIVSNKPEFIFVRGGKNEVIAKPLLPGRREVIIHCFDAEHIEHLSNLAYEIGKANASKFKKNKYSFYNILLAIKRFLMS